MTEEYECMKTKFEVEKVAPSGSVRLCPGEYTVRGCETNKAGACPGHPCARA
jgi:hypothetical protein